MLFLQSTALESPQFAVIILFEVISTTLAVHPQLNEILFVLAYDPSKFFLSKLNCYSPSLLEMYSSTFLNVSINAYLYFCYLYSLLFVNCVTNTFSTNFDTYGP